MIVHEWSVYVVDKEKSNVTRSTSNTQMAVVIDCSLMRQAALLLCQISHFNNSDDRLQLASQTQLTTVSSPRRHISAYCKYSRHIDKKGYDRPPIVLSRKQTNSNWQASMANYGYQPNPQQSSYSAQNNLNFYQSSYSQQPVSGHSTPFQAAYGNSAQSNAYPQQGGYGGSNSANYGFGAFPGQPGATGQMGTGQSGLRTGWLAAFGTEGYEGEPPLLEELGVNFGHIQMKVGQSISCIQPVWKATADVRFRLSQFSIQWLE
jgi:hypothetical protein